MNKRIWPLLIIILIISGCKKEMTIGFYLPAGTEEGETPYEMAMNYYEKRDFKNAINSFERVLADMEIGLTEKGINEFWIKGMIGRTYLEMSEYDLAGGYIEDAIEGYKENKETGRGYAIIAQTEGIYFRNIGEIEKAIQSLEESIKYTDLEDDNSVRSYIELGSCYEEIGEEEKQVECYQKAMEHGEKQGDYAALTQLYNSWGIYYAERGDTQKGEELFKKSLECARSVWGEESAGVANVYQKLASNCNLEGRYEEAIQYSEKALHIFENIAGHYERDIASIYNNMGCLNMELDDDDTALLMMRRSYEIVKESNGEDKDMSRFYENVLSVNIKDLYNKTAADQEEYGEWFEQNFESYVEDTE